MFGGREEVNGRDREHCSLVFCPTDGVRYGTTHADRLTCADSLLKKARDSHVLALLMQSRPVLSTDPGR